MRYNYLDYYSRMGDSTKTQLRLFIFYSTTKIGVTGDKKGKERRNARKARVRGSKRVESQFRRSNKLFEPVESLDCRRPLPSTGQDLIQWKRSAFNAARAAAFARSVTIDRLQTYLVGHVLNASF